MRPVCLILYLLTIGTTNVRAQQLSIGQIPYRLGMSFQEAMAITHEPIYLDNVSGSGATGTWTVREKHGEEYTAIGSMLFRNGKVETITSDLKGYFSKDSRDVGNVLFQGLERLHHEDPAVTIRTRNVFMSSQSGEVRIITIGTGRRRLEIAVPSATNAEMTISEVLTLAEE